MLLADTSALIALMNPNDRYYEQALTAYKKIKLGNTAVAVTSYVVVETHAILDRRNGRESARGFVRDLAPLMAMLWVDAPLHEAGLEIWQRSTRHLSLVDAVTMAALQRYGPGQVWTYDRDFESQGCAVFG